MDEREAGAGGEAGEGSSPRVHEDMRLAHFLSMLIDENPGNRWKAAESLARMGDPRGVEPLIAALGDEDWRVRQKAAWALGDIGDPRALLPLRRAMMHEMDTVKQVMVEATDRIVAKMAGEEPAPLAG